VREEKHGKYVCLAYRIKIQNKKISQANRNGKQIQQWGALRKHFAQRKNF